MHNTLKCGEKKTGIILKDFLTQLSILIYCPLFFKLCHYKKYTIYL